MSAPTTRFGLRRGLRGDLSEFAPSIAETIESVGDELASLARDSCPAETDRRQLIDGLEGALRSLGLSDAAQVHIVSQLAPRIMAGEPASATQGSVDANGGVKRSRRSGGSPSQRHKSIAPFTPSRPPPRQFFPYVCAIRHNPKSRRRPPVAELHVS